MGWDKNTVVLSDLDVRVAVLRDMGATFELKIRGVVKGFGLNDDENKTYELRELRYHGRVIAEVMVREHDCDADDCVVSREFAREQEFREANLPLEYYNYDPDYDVVY
jgi:hypothetical protein